MPCIIIGENNHLTVEEYLAKFPDVRLRSDADISDAVKKDAEKISQPQEQKESTSDENSDRNVDQARSASG